MVSIIIPIFNTKEYLEKCVLSALKQTFRDIEIILVDDGSNDGSELICDLIGQADQRVKVVHKKRGENNGVSAARNTGIDIAAGDYIVFLDADDWLDVDIIEKAVVNFKENYLNYWGCKLFMPCDKILTEQLNIPDLSRNELIANAIFPLESEYNIGNYFRAVWGKIFNREVIVRNGIRFPEDLYIGEDAVFLIRYMKYVEGINLISETGYNYNRINDSSATSRYNPDMFEQNSRQYKYITDEMRSDYFWGSRDGNICASMINFRWWMFCTLFINSKRGIKNKQLPLNHCLSDSCRWLERYMEDMKIGTDNCSAIRKEYRNLYLKRNKLSPKQMCAYYLFLKIKNKFIRC